jgi:hypothetical protein
MSKLNLKTLKAGDRIRITLDGAVVEEDFVVGGRPGLSSDKGAVSWFLFNASGDRARYVGTRAESNDVYADRGWELEKI